MSATSEQGYFRTGFRNGLPFLVVAMPFGMLFGVVATEAGFSLAQTMGFSVIVIAGTAQFAAVQLMTENAPTLIVLATALAVNLRMAMYSASLAPHLGKASTPRRLMMAYFMVDQSYSLGIAKFEDNPEMELAEKVAYYTGSVLAFLPFWYFSTFLGATIGTAIPPEWGLDMAMPLMFLAMIGPMLRSFAHMAAAMTSAVVALVLAFLPWNLGLMVAAFAALAVGAEVERRWGRK